MINYLQNNYSFTGRSPLPKNIKEVKRVFFSEFADVKKPASYSSLPKEKQIELAKEIKESNMLLRVIRELQHTAYEEGGNFEVFRRLIGMLKTFKVGNCAELAETGKTICKMNRINNCDIFTLHAKSPDGKIRALDQTMIAFKVPKSKNNRITKKNGTMFEPAPNIPVLDLYMNGFSGNVRQSRKIYSSFGLKPDEKLLFKPENTYEPDINTIEKLRQEFPSLVFNK
ncbi:unknown [Brachyspira sp. CAG:484]|nr:unknown [Brachyspira sp. CAG:484]